MIKLADDVSKLHEKNERLESELKEIRGILIVNFLKPSDGSHRHMLVWDRIDQTRIKSTRELMMEALTKLISELNKND